MKLDDRVTLPDMVTQMKREGIEVIESAAGVHFATCPLCNDTDMSMTINDERQIFVCSNCDRGGRIHTFIKYLKGFSSKQAVLYLVKQAAIDMANEKKEAQKIINSLEANNEK